MSTSGGATEPQLFGRYVQPSDGGCAAKVLVASNRLLVASPQVKALGIGEGTVDLIWVDARPRSNRPGEPHQLSLFDFESRESNEELAKRSAALVEERASRFLASLNVAGHVFVLTTALASHRIRLVLDRILAGELFAGEIPIAAEGATKSRAVRETEYLTVIMYRRSPDAVLHWADSAEHDAWVEQAYRRVEAETGRRYTLAACVHSRSHEPSLRYEWNGNTRVWRWNRVQMEELYAAGKLVLTRSGIPRLKRYLDEVERRRRPPGHRRWPGAACDSLGPNLALARHVVTTATREGGWVLDATSCSGRILEAAHTCGRHWIAWSESHSHATRIRNDLRRCLGDSIDATYTHEPNTITSALALADANPDEYVAWVLGALGAVPSSRRAGNAGIDGKLIMAAAPLPVVVKARALRPEDIRDAATLRRRINAAAIIVAGTNTNDIRDSLSRSKEPVYSVSARQLVMTERRKLLWSIEMLLRRSRQLQASLSSPARARRQNSG